MVAFFLLVFPLGASVWAETYRDGHEEKSPVWIVELLNGGGRLLEHRIDPQVASGGKTGEFLRIEQPRDGADVRLAHPLPASRAFDDLKASIMVRANRPGMTLALRLTCVGSRHPQTGDPLSVFIQGDAYTAYGKWQKLECRTSDKAVAEQLRILRARFPQQFDTAQLIVDRVVLASHLERGVTDLAIDELEFGPLVVPLTGIQTVAGSVEEDETLRHAEFRLDQLLVDGRPMFPRLVPWHDEAPDALKTAGFNLVWTPQWNDAEQLRRLSEARLWATAVPPRPQKNSGEGFRRSEAGLLPFGTETEGILFWTLGSRIQNDLHQEVVDWVDQIQSADRKFRRPIAADVIGAERIYSRHIDLLGMSRHTLNSSLPLGEYRNWLKNERQRSRPGTFLWTWVQTEPDPQLAAMQRPGGNPFSIEPEQIRLETWAAITAGYRGIGYWTTQSLDSQEPMARERFLTLTLLNYELALIEPWLATAGIPTEASVSIDGAEPTAGQRSMPFGSSPSSKLERDAKLKDRQTKLRAAGKESTELTAHVMRTDFGTLVVPLWLEGYSQFTPSRLAENKARVIVSGATETAFAVELSPVGKTILSPKRIAGGFELIVPQLDQASLILLTSDKNTVAQIEAKASAIQRPYAEAWLELTRLKLERVRQVDVQLQKLGVPQVDGPQILGAAKLQLDRAEQSFRTESYRDCVDACRAAMQHARILQRAHWDDAVDRGRDRRILPLASPYTACFQTLPDHWALLAEVGRAPLTNLPNLLPSGDFEPRKTTLEGWLHEQSDYPDLIAGAELYPDGYKSKYSLRISGLPKTLVEPKAKKDEAAPIPNTPIVAPIVRCSTPEVDVSAGQIVYVTGRIRMRTPLTGGVDGMVISDNIMKKAGALRFRETKNDDWEQFELLRPILNSGTFQLTFDLMSHGDTFIDDLEIRVLTPGIATAVIRHEEQPRATSVRERLTGNPFRGGKVTNREALPR